jgi:uncharacterized membrane protein YhaH (DUF805 family)
MNNPYIAPAADLSHAGSSNTRYEPKVFAVNGRIGRLRYLAYLMLMSLLGGLVIGIFAGIAAVLGALVNPLLGGVLYIIVALLLYIPMLAMTVILAKRRLNDLGQSGWLYLLMFVPLVNFLFALYVIFARGTDGPNEYGPAPTENTTPVLIGAFALPVFMVVAIVATVALGAYSDHGLVRDMATVSAGY